MKQRVRLLSASAGIRCNKLTTLAFKIDRLLADAARSIVRTLLEDGLPPLSLSREPTHHARQK